MAKYSTKMIFAVLDASLIMGLNIGETDKVFYINICIKNELSSISLSKFNIRRGLSNKKVL